MADEIDDTTAAAVGHALVRWLVNEDPAGVARFAPGIGAGSVDDAKASRVGRALVDLLQQIDVA